MKRTALNEMCGDVTLSSVPLGPKCVSAPPLVSRGTDATYLVGVLVFGGLVLHVR